MATTRRPPPIALQFNKLAAKVAGTRAAPTWAVIEHRGRKSGKAYRAPVEIIGATDEVLYVGLAWGPNTDWMRNLRAADGGTVRWRGRTIPIGAPVPASQEEVFAVAGPVSRFALSRMKLEEFVKLPRRSPGPS